MGATVRDVARRCGLDPIIVRRVLNNAQADVDEAARQGVVDAAKELGYEHRLPVRPPTLGVLFSEESGRGLTHPFFSLVLNAFKAEAEARGYDVAFIHAAGDYAHYCAAIDGVCMVCMDFRAAHVRELVDSGVPCLAIDHIFKGALAVLSDNETGIQKLVDYAVSRGHRRVAFIHGQDNSIVTRTRIDQFHNATAYHGLQLPPDYVREGRYHNIALTRKLVLELLRLPERPTCILLPDDICYLGAQEAARELGVSIPKDISFAGYDGIPLTQTLTPRLTTIRQSGEQMGRSAATRLIDLIERPETASRKPLIFPVELLEGGTIGEV